MAKKNPNRTPWYLALISQLRSRHPRSCSPEQCWRRRSWAALFLLLILIMAAVGFYFLNDDTIKKQAIKALEAATGGKVELDNARVQFPNEIHIHGLKIFLPDCARSKRNMFFSADRVVLEYQAHWLPGRKIDLHRVVASNAVLSIWFNRRTQCRNIDQLNFQSSENKPSRTEFILRNARFEYAEYDGEKALGSIAQEISGRIVPDEADANIYSIQLASQDVGVFQNTRLTGRFDMTTRQFELKTDFDLDDVDLKSAPESMKRLGVFYESMAPRGEVAVSGEYTINQGFVFDVAIRHGSMVLPLIQAGMNLEVANIDALVRCSSDRIDVVKLQLGLDEHCQVNASGHIDGYGNNPAYTLHFTTQGFSLPPDYWDDFQVTEPRSKSTLDVLLLGDVITVPLNHQGLKTLIGFMHPKAQKAMYDHRPTGVMDLDITAVMEPKAEKPDISGRIVMKQVDANSRYFPYPAHGLAGTIEFGHHRVKVGPIQNLPDYRPVRIDGEFVRVGEGTQFDLAVDIDSLPFDKTLYQAIPPTYQKIWDQLHPQGQVSGHYQISGEPDKKPQQSLKLTLSDCRARPDVLPVDLEHLFGQIDWNSQAMQVNIEKGQALEGEVSIQGIVSGLNIGATQADMGLSFKRVKVDRTFGHMLDGRLAQIWNDYGLEARLDGMARIGIHPDQKKDSPSGYDLKLDTRFQQAVIDPNDYPVRLTDGSGHLQWDGQKLLVKEFRGRYRDQVLAGSFEMADKDHYCVNAQADQIVLDDALKKMVSQSVSLLNTIDVDGPMAIAGQFCKEEDTYRYDIGLDLKNCSMGLKQKPLRFEQTRGHVQITPEDIQVSDLYAQAGAATLRGYGKVDLSGNNPDSSLHLQMEHLQLDDILRALVCDTPDCDRLQWEANGRGRVDLKAGWQPTTDGKGGWQIDWKAQIHQGAIAAPLSFDGIAGTLQGVVQLGPDPAVLKVTGGFDSLEFRYKHFLLSNLSGQYRYDREKAVLRFDELAGKLGRGRLAGSTQIHLDSSGGYDATVQFIDVPIADLTEELPDGQEPLPGLMEGRVSLIVPKADEPRRGQFYLVMDHTRLGELPLLAQFMHVINLTVPRPGAFDMARIEGDIMAEKLRLGKIVLQGSAMSLTGTGYAYNSIISAGDSQADGHDYDLVFVVDAPKYLPDVPVVSSLYDAIRPQLVQFQVTGTLANPQVKPAAFPSLSEALFQLERPRQ